ncbi:hypothetical protein PTTG_03256, partial [Puccinia triticina 1-1 BBBD Race 1]
MSISQLDPSLLSSQPLNQSPGTPNLADLSLGSEFSGISMGRTRSEADPNRANEKPKRSRRTKAQMAAYRADLERSKKLTAVEKITEGAKRGRKGRRGRSSQRSAPGTSTSANSTSSTPAASQVSVSDSNPAFVLSDYENVCGYLEVEANYTRLYGDGAKTTVGTPKVTKAAAYDMFAIFINDNSNHRLHLSGSQLRQRINGYKKRFAKAKHFADNTGAGIEEGDDMPTLAELLEKKCPCYERMYSIFGTKANITPLRDHDSVRGANLYDDQSEIGGEIAETQDLPSSHEVFYSGWEETQDEPMPSQTQSSTLVGL